jgi:hypothetical protein
LIAIVLTRSEAFEIWIRSVSKSEAMPAVVSAGGATKSGSADARDDSSAAAPKSRTLK